MSLEKFKKKIEKMIESSDEFVVHEGRDFNLETVDKRLDNLVVCGEDDTEIFVLTISKIV